MKNENNEYKMNNNLNKIKKERNDFHPFKEEIPPDDDLNINDNDNERNESDNNSDNKEDEEEDEGKYTNEEYIKEVMGQGVKINDVNNIDNILDLNNKINSEDKEENYLDNEESENDEQINEEEKNKIKQILKENTDNFENDFDKDEDSREIYKMYEEKLTQKNNLTKFNNKKDQVIQGLNCFKTKIVDNSINNTQNYNE